MPSIEQERNGDWLPKVAIVVLNWNDIRNTNQCLASLRELDYPDFIVIVVDNASSDGSSDFIKNDFPEVILVEN